MTTHDQQSGQDLLELTRQFLKESEAEHLLHQLTLNSSLQRHLGVDSLGRAELFRRIEKKFDVTLPDALMAEAETLDDILNSIYSASKRDHVTQQQMSEIISASHADPSQAKTLIDVLLLHAISTPDRPHIYLQDENGKEEIITYQILLDNALRVANALQKRGLRAGETVAIMLPTTAGFFYAFFGTLLAGCIPVPIYPPFRKHQIESYAKLEANILRNAQARILITFHEAEHLSKLLRAFIPSLKEITTVKTLLAAEEKAAIFPAKSDDFALIQYTSGSTSTPKGVLLTHQNLLSNLRSYGQAIQVSAHDVAVSWVPLYHDLGLIGMWFGSLYNGIPLTIMSPLTFLNHPEKWLWAMHYHRGTLSGGPNFAYELCVRKIEPEMIEGLDLSSWRLAINGAEAIQAGTMERFTKKFEPYGFKAEAFFPVYGLAESTVCVSTPPLGRGPRIDTIDRKSFEEQQLATPTTDTNEKNSLQFVACGKAIPDHAIRIVDKHNHALPERHNGLLQFKGPSSMQGYYGNPEATSAVHHDGWWDTGDMAYMADDEIFITGRKKDLIIKAGRNLYPTEIEEITASVASVRKGCIIAFGVSDTERGTEKLIIVAETAEKKSRVKQTMIQMITEKMIASLDIAPDHIILVSPGTIPKTSSGKLQRSACKSSYLAGKLTKRPLPTWLQISKLALRSALLRTGHFLALFGKALYTLYLVSLMIGTLIPVWLSLFIFPQKISSYICKYWSKFICLLSGSPVRILHKQELTTVQPVIYAVNHTSYIDPFILMGALPAGTCMVGKHELFSTPILRTFLTKLGHLPVNRMDFSKSNEDTKQIVSALQNGKSVVIFPEGTFTHGAGLRPFKLGTFKIAAETNTPVCPISLNGTRQMLRGDEKLFQPAFIKIIVSKPIHPTGTSWSDINHLKNTVRQEIAANCGEPTLDMIM